jgi:hypothetical protein
MNSAEITGSCVRNCGSCEDFVRGERTNCAVTQLMGYYSDVSEEPGSEMTLCCGAGEAARWRTCERFGAREGFGAMSKVIYCVQLASFHNATRSRKSYTPT